MSADAKGLTWPHVSAGGGRMLLRNLQIYCNTLH